MISSEVLNKSILNLLFSQVTVPFLLSPSHLLFLHPCFLLSPLSSSSCHFSFSPSFSSHTCIIIFYPIMYLHLFRFIYPSSYPFFLLSLNHSSYCLSINLSFLPPNLCTHLLIFTIVNTRRSSSDLNCLSLKQVW